MPFKTKAQKQAYNASYRLKHQEEIRAYKRAYALANPDKFRVWHQAYLTAHREEERARLTTLAKAHPEKSRERTQRRRARLRSQFVAPVDAQAIYARDGGLCHLCGKLVRQEEASMDHVIPISKGGEHSPQNVKLAHRLCNCRRSAQPLVVEVARG